LEFRKGKVKTQERSADSSQQPEILSPGLASTLKIGEKMRIQNGKIHDLTLMHETEGTEEWYCQFCGRRLLVSWSPRFEKTVLESGDVLAVHGGGKFGLQSGIMDAPFGHASLLEDERLEPWVRWLEEVGFESLWNSDIGL
jgi:hypothetical protein